MNYSSPETIEISNINNSKIPRPPNAFMLYANDHRKSMAYLYPADSNKEISRRLGQTWKDLSPQKKSKYFSKAKDIDKEHKRKYPGYVYNPKDARMRKAIRTNLKDRFSMPFNNDSNRGSSINLIDNLGFYQNLMLADFLCQNNLPFFTSNNNAETAGEPEQLTSLDETPAWQSILPSNFFEITEADKNLYEKENPTLQAAEDYEKISKSEAFNYVPISATRIIEDPELYTNNAEYHKEYIVKYFNNIPDYEAYTVTTEDGSNFPYVTLRPSILRQNINNADV